MATLKEKARASIRIRVRALPTPRSGNAGDEKGASSRDITRRRESSLHPLTTAPAPGGWPGLGTGPQRRWGAPSGGSHPRLPPELPSDWHFHHFPPPPRERCSRSRRSASSGCAMQLLSCEGREPGTPREGGSGEDGVSLGRELRPGDNSSDTPPVPRAQRAEPTSRPRSWLSAGTARGRSPSGCALPG